MLIVDDSALDREILRLQFENLFEIIECADGDEALSVLEKCNGNIDIVLLDLMMPGKSGFDVLRKRQNLPWFKDVPVIVITASNALEDQLKAFELGANDFINKPFISEIVIPRIGNVLAATQRIAFMKESERLRVQNQLDEMTGLYNKPTAERMIASVLEREPYRTHALLVIDIDDFKSVNDTYGHLVGDHTIRIIADAISGLFRKSDIVGRIGGDEFAVLMVSVPSATIVRSKVSELIQLMKYRPNLTLPANVSLSIGYALTNGDPTDYNELFTRADQALYQAKRSGKARSHEHGVTPISPDDDHRPGVLLVGRNRSVCTMLDAQLSDRFRLIEVGTIDELPKLTAEVTSEALFAFVDASDVNANPDAFWGKVMRSPDMQRMPIIAICGEGNLTQIRAALKVQVADVLTSPLESNLLRRRVEHLLLS